MNINQNVLSGNSRNLRMLCSLVHLLFLSSIQLLAVGSSHAQEVQFQPATTVQLPVFGVSVNADGVLEHVQFAPAGGQIFFERARAAAVRMDQDLLKQSPLRKVSLKRLQAAIESQLDNGQELPDEILKLAGLQRIEYVFAFPDKNDVVIAGPAEGWVQNAGGRTVGITSGRPVVLLEDLLTALRIYAQDLAPKTWVGCSIGSTTEGRRRLSELERRLPRQISQRDEQAYAEWIVPQIEEALGEAVVSVFGIPDKTNMVRVLLEADFRMKLIAIGREPPPIEMPTFIGKLKGAPRNNFQRWWFTPNYKCVQVSDDKLSFQMVGQGVQLGTEEYKQDGQGNLIQKKTKPLRAARLYAEAFTKDYEKIAAASPVFGQLRNMIDVLIVANYIQRERLFERAGLDPVTLLDNEKIPVDIHEPASGASSLANAQWKNNRMVAPAGGVCVVPAEALRESNLLKGGEAKLLEAKVKIALPADEDAWWWD